MYRTRVLGSAQRAAVRSMGWFLSGEVHSCFLLEVLLYPPSLRAIRVHHF